MNLERLKESYRLLREFGRHEDLREWNRVQFELWMALGAQGLVNPRDANSFGKFGAFFFDFWEQNERVPSIEDVSSQFLNDSSFIIEISHIKHKILTHFSLIFRNCSVPSQWTVATE